MDELTVKRTAAQLKLSVRMVQIMVAKGADGPFPGARRLDPDDPKSTIVIPSREVQAEIKRRAQSSD